MDASLIAAAGVGWMGAPTADSVVARFRSSCRRVMAIDGFMGSGKSPFASMIEARLQSACIRVDGYLPVVPPDGSPSFLDRLNLSALQDQLEQTLKNGPAIIEGILMRALLNRLAPVRVSAFHVYVAGAWKPDEHRVTWPDAGQLESCQSSDLYRQIVAYHSSDRPHECFDAAVLRNQDEPEASGAYIAPDGQTFAIPESVYSRSQLEGLRGRRTEYKSGDADAVLEPIGLIRPPTLGASTRSLNGARLASILHAIRTEAPLPPVPIIREEGRPVALLLDGAHRYFASVAAGFTRIPTIHISRDDAEIGFRYTPSESSS